MRYEQVSTRAREHASTRARVCSNERVECTVRHNNSCTTRHPPSEPEGHAPSVSFIHTYLCFKRSNAICLHQLLSSTQSTHSRSKLCHFRYQYQRVMHISMVVQVPVLSKAAQRTHQRPCRWEGLENPNHPPQFLRRCCHVL
jgi:hypothetical protein